ncbi:hypothetical protein PPL_05003 [Heterostelium album PN500]|uniref:DUF1731 domain-containing protein n=1 Tax=Heterostelium pallidum (strain ATCC 26659 / Pp 5 / PN500) TaxID=670386 RepID=D3B959_HETP5|nr:hypothetical protein PPL_05003 [Heterostelium album PN500]EFA82098.1 hypothetical protein PPL_05003 [Heterostelium album PN500]|eukprot:XP_020434215.1 hypothetical protein PPL_05003 [Heterostelium album PN500]
MGRVLNRPTFFWVPEFVINTVFGREMATETILSSQRVLPNKLMDYGYQFVDTDLEKTLRKQLSR